MNITGVKMDFEEFCREHFYSSGEFQRAFEEYLAKNNEFLKDSFEISEQSE